MGGGLLTPETGKAELERYVLELTGKPKPRVLFLATATGDDLSYVARFYETYARLGAEPSHVPLFRRTPADLHERLLAQDVIHVGGGNTRSMLAVWHAWAIDVSLRAAWERGVVLTGSSAGGMCWFEQGLTDSVAGDLVTMPCLGFLSGSFCPHYDGEKDRRPLYRRCVASGRILPGLASTTRPPCTTGTPAFTRTSADVRAPASTGSTASAMLRSRRRSRCARCTGRRPQNNSVRYSPARVNPTRS